MPDLPTQERINRSFSDQVRTLSAERDRYQFMVLTRAVHSFSEVVDGIEQVAAQAGQGDPEARHLLVRLHAALGQASALAAGLILPAKPNGG